MPFQREAAAALELYGVLGGQLAADDCRYLGKSPTRRRQHEAGEQAALIQWASLSVGRFPELRLLFHIPNGGSRKGGVIEGAHLKAQGVRAGVPDLCLPVARGGYHGLFVEMKATGGRVQDTQKHWNQQLAMQGYLALVCHGFDEARRAIEKYLSGEAIP